MMDMMPNLSRFKQYTQSKQLVAHQIRSLMAFLRKHVGEKEAEECRQWMVKLTEDRFTLAVVGQFKRGKSSLMNAVIGQDILPTGVFPLTSVITVLKYGPLERLSVLREDAVYAEEVSISRLAEFVTENGNPGNVKKVVYASLELPSPFLRNGLEFVDTPGIGSAIEANTATTCGFLPQSDAVVFVTSVDTPISGAETDFLRKIREHVRKIFFVVNKIDLVTPNECQQVLDFVSGILMRTTDAEDLRIFPVSSVMALESKLAQDNSKYEESGLKTFQEALSDFLLNEKSSVLLISILDKVMRLADRASCELNLLETAGNIPQGMAQEKLTALKDRFQTLKNARKDMLDTVQKQVMTWAANRISSEINAFLTGDVRVLLVEIYHMLSRMSWQLSRSVMKNVALNSVPRFRQDLEQWTKQQTERFHSEILGILRREWPTLELSLHQIPTAAAEVLEDTTKIVSSGDATSECPIHGVATTPNFEKIEWRLRSPFGMAWLPVFVTRHWLRKRLTENIETLMAACADHLNETFMNSIHCVMDQLTAEIEKRAVEIESRIVQALKGKRLSKGINGHWQLSDLDREGLAMDIHFLAEIREQFVSIRSDMLRDRAISTGDDPADTPIRASNFKYPDFSTSKAPEPVFLPTVSESEENIERDLNTRGCPVCNRIGDAVSRFLATWQYEFATQERTQREHAAFLGFCSLHTWQQEAISSPLGLSQGLPFLIDKLSTELAAIAASPDSDAGSSVLALVGNSAHCRVCHLMKDAETTYLKSLAEFLKTPHGQNAYTYSKGLCLTHLSLLLRHRMPENVMRLLLEHAARRFAEISEDMQNYALKRDALLGGFQNLDEEDAYLRGIVHHIGSKKVCYPWNLNAAV